MFLQVKKNKRKLIEKIEKVKAERKPFMLERLTFKQKKTQKTEMISSFINKLDNNWKMMQKNLSLRNRLIKENVGSQYGFNTQNISSLNTKSISKHLGNRSYAKINKESDDVQNESTRDFSSFRHANNKLDLNDSYDYDKFSNFDKLKHEMSKKRVLANFSNRNQHLPKVRNINQFVKRSLNKSQKDSLIARDISIETINSKPLGKAEFVLGHPRTNDHDISSLSPIYSHRSIIGAFEDKKNGGLTKSPSKVLPKISKK